MRFSVTAAALAAALIAAPAHAGPQLGSAGVVEQTKKTVVYIGRRSESGEASFYATGFLVHIQGIYHLITAKHAVMEAREGGFTGRMIDDGVHIFANKRGGGLAFQSISDLKEHFHVEWMFHPDERVDIAIIPLPLAPERLEYRVIPEELFLPLDKLYETCDLYFMSFQPGIGSGEVDPVIRRGMVSRIDDDGTFYMDGASFPGYSGSPVFVKPDGSGELGGKFVGVVGAYVPFEDVAVSAQSLRPRVVFEENTGLSRIWSASYIREIIATDRFQEQVRRISQLEP